MADPGESYAQLYDVTDLMPSLTDAERTSVGALLGHASALLRAAVPDLDARLASGALDPSLARLAVVNMVLRVAPVIRNPNGLRSETVGPVSRTFDTSGAASAQLVVTAADVALVAAPAARRPARQIQLGAALGYPGGADVRRW